VKDSDRARNVLADNAALWTDGDIVPLTNPAAPEDASTVPFEQAFSSQAPDFLKVRVRPDSVGHMGEMSPGRTGIRWRRFVSSPAGALVGPRPYPLPLIGPSRLPPAV